MNIVFNTKKKNRYCGKILPVGCVYGRDSVSQFYAEPQGLIEKGKSSGLKATMLIYRFDSLRGWSPVWEQSKTTCKIREKFYTKEQETFEQIHKLEQNWRSKACKSAEQNWSRKKFNESFKKYKQEKKALSDSSPYRTTRFDREAPRLQTAFVKNQRASHIRGCTYSANFIATDSLKTEIVSSDYGKFDTDKLETVWA